MPTRPRVLVLAPVEVGRRLSGAAVRPYELARALAAHADVRLAMPHAPEDPAAGVEPVVFAHQDPSALAEPLRWADAVIAQPQWPLLTRLLARSGARLIYDLYVPEPLELLEAHVGRRPRVRAAWQTLALDRHVDAVRTGHHLVCASEVQRDLWLGFLMGLRVLSPALYDRDPGLRSVVDVVPLGVPAEPAAAVGPGIRAQFPGVGPDDEVVVWNGGIWAWLDAPTAVEAIHRLRRTRPGARLVFMGRGTHEAAARATREVEDLARRLGLLGDGVLVHDGWVPYDERASWLLEADVAVSTHVDHLETRFAFRTRLTDCFWAGLPVVCTRGDELADRVAREDLGVVVPEQDPAAVAAGLDAVLTRGRAAYAGRFEAARGAYAWPRVIAPIVGWLGEPLPPRLGRAGARRPLHTARDAAYVGARRALNRAGFSRWPGG